MCFPAMAEPNSANSRSRRRGSSDAAPAPATPEDPRPLDAAGSDLPGWLTEAVGEGDQPQQQALALMGLGLMHRMAGNQATAWTWREEEDGGQADAQALRQRLESIDLAIRTAAPLSTAEVTHLLGARPGSAVVERGGLRARRQNRNVWVLSRAEGNRRESGDRDDRNDGFGSSFHDGRRRF
jgi:hypothetical protein